MQFHTRVSCLRCIRRYFYDDWNAAYSASAVSAASSAVGFFLPNLALSRPTIVGISESTRIGDDHQFEVILHGRNVAEEVAQQREQRGPAQAAEH